MGEEPVTDSSGSQNPKGVRFNDALVDKDLSIHPSAHNENNLESLPSGQPNRNADRYYKDMQSIHGDQVRPALQR